MLSYLDPTNVLAAFPIGVLVTLSLTVLVLDLFGLCRLRTLWLCLSCLLAWFAALPQLFAPDIGTAFQSTVYVDSFAFVFITIILFGTIAALMLCYRQLEQMKAASGIDVEMLLILSACGGMVMVSSAHLIVLFVGFELLSVPVYVLAGSARRERSSAEGAVKYFILGAFSSAFLLYGMTLVYGATGSMVLHDIAAFLSQDARHGSNLMLLVGIGLIVFGFGFKVSLVPFHVWAPDVYQGAPTPIATFMAVVVKAAAFGSFLRLMAVSFGEVTSAWAGLIWSLSLLTMTVGNLAALRQQSLKRMLAYSSVAHAGYALMGFLALGKGGADASVFYIAVYALMTIASFGVLQLLTSKSEAQYERDDLQSLAGAGWSQPFIGIVMCIAMLSLAGMPPLAGFVGKFYLFTAVINSGYVGLAVIAALNSVVSLYYYLRVLVVMYFGVEKAAADHAHAPAPEAPAVRFDLVHRGALLAATLGIIYLGIFSETCMPAIAEAVRSLG